MRLFLDVWKAQRMGLDPGQTMDLYHQYLSSLKNGEDSDRLTAEGDQAMKT